MIKQDKSFLLYGCNDEIFKLFFDSGSNKLYLCEDMSPEFVLLMDRGTV